ncbi:DUF4130 domain-containing protein [Chryseobacterium cucumeris]|uniref:DUF4130 domain-containing protein n=1 Tax=Chryseobacterium cucumeris TaxID=1813611 RepID=UPI001F4AE3B8|nr:DUF4130 domain-containing protein [Chryseobacterium cucumeris]
MTTLLYDGSFDGLFTAIFEVFEYRYKDVEIASSERFHQENIFAEIHEVITQPDKSERVLNKLEQNIGKQGVYKLLKVFLSEDPDLENLILSAVRQSVKKAEINILGNYGLLYNLNDCEFFYPDEKLDLNHYQQKFHDEEKGYQLLWQRYFTKTNIVERKNMKLHIQHVPKRYWKYLTEKW